MVGATVSPYGSRSKFEKAVRHVNQNTKVPLQEASSRTPLHDTYGIITPSSLHFERHHGGVPDIDPATHTLTIHGMVDRPLVFTVDDLKRMPAVSRIHFLECSGNSGGEWRGGSGETETDLRERVDHRLLSGELATAREEKHGGTENLKNPGNRDRCARSCSRQRCCRHDLLLRESVDCRYMNFRPEKKSYPLSFASSVCSVADSSAVSAPNNASSASS